MMPFQLANRLLVAVACLILVPVQVPARPSLPAPQPTRTGVTPASARVSDLAMPERRFLPLIMH